MPGAEVILELAGIGELARQELSHPLAALLVQGARLRLALSVVLGRDDVDQVFEARRLDPEGGL